MPKQFPTPPEPLTPSLGSTIEPRKKSRMRVPCLPAALAEEQGWGAQGLPLSTPALARGPRLHGQNEPYNPTPPRLLKQSRNGKRDPAAMGIRHRSARPRAERARGAGARSNMRGAGAVAAVWWPRPSRAGARTGLAASQPGPGLEKWGSPVPPQPTAARTVVQALVFDLARLV